MNLTGEAGDLPMEHDDTPLSRIPTPAPDSISIAPTVRSPTAQPGPDGGGDDPDDPDSDGEPDVPPRLMRDRCDPCKERGRNSKCNKHWPTCAKCIACGTEERCFEGAANLDAIRHAARGIAPNLAAPRTPTMRRAASAAPVLQNTHANQLRRTLNLRQVPNAPLPIRVDRRSRSPPRQPAPRDTGRVRSPPVPQQQPDFDALARLEQRSALLEEELVRTKALLATHVAGSIPVPPLLGFSSGQFQPPVEQGRLIPNTFYSSIHAGQDQTTRRMPETIQGHVGARVFMAIPYFVRKYYIGSLAGTTPVPLACFTDEFCSDSSNHHDDTERLRIGSDGTLERSSVRKLDSEADKHLTDAQWDRAWLRRLEFYQSINYPKLGDWQAHYHMIKREPDFYKSFGKWLEYDIRVRHRVFDEGIDPKTMQWGILAEISVEYDKAQYKTFIRTAVSQEVARQVEVERARQPTTSHSTRQSNNAANAQAVSTPFARVDKSHKAREKPAPKVAICFLCGDPAHRAINCSASKSIDGRDIIPSKNDEGIWTIDGAEFCYRFNGGAGCSDTGCSRCHILVTPLVADAWESELKAAMAWDLFSDVPTGLRNGFHLGVSSILSFTTVHNNHASATRNPDAVMTHISNELSAGRYSGPFSYDELFSLIGHFRASPLGVVDKPSAPGSFRIIQDFSFPRDPNSPTMSVNSEINAEDFPTEWGFFHDVVDIILNSPPGSQAATFDVDAAYRRMPVHPDDQPHIIVHWEGRFYIDHCAPFGAVCSNGIFGRCGDGICRIFRAHGIGPILKWVDDFLFFRSPQTGPDGSLVFSYDEEDIYRLAVPLGWPWKASKTCPFSNIFNYLGFEWDIKNCTVSIPKKKKDKFLAKINKWLTMTKASLIDTESLLGSLIHCALALPIGQSRVSGIARFTSSFSHDHKDRYVTRKRSHAATEEALWWQAQLNQSFCGSLLQAPPPLANTEFFMDASTSFGVGIVTDQHYCIWRLKPNALNRGAGRDIGWAEMVALELALRWAIFRGLSNCSLPFWSDNQGVIGAFRMGRSRNEEQNRVLMRIQEQMLKFNIHVVLNYVNTKDNVADGPSRGVHPKGFTHHVGGHFTPPELLKFIQHVG